MAEISSQDKFNYYLENYWLFSDEYKNSKLAQEVEKLGNVQLWLEHDIPEQKRIASIDEIIFSLSLNQLDQLLFWFKNLMGVLTSSEAKGIVPMFINEIGARINEVYNWKRAENEKNKKPERK